MKYKNKLVSISFAVFLVCTFLNVEWLKVSANFLILTAFYLADRNSLRAGGVKFWIFPVLFFAMLPFLNTEPDATALGLGYSKSALFQNAAFLLHAYVFAVILAFASRNYSARELVELTEKKKILASAGLRTALAMSLLKRMKNMLVETHFFYKAASGGGLRYFLGMNRLFFAVLRNTERMARETAVLFFARKVKI